MRPWLRVVLVWLLAAALPLQGWAAATMLSCGPGHHQRVASAQHDAGHGAHHHLDEAALQADAAAPFDSGDLHALAKVKCSACAACCLSAALPASVQPFEAERTAQFVAPSLPQASAVFLTSGVERPPRA